jgi:hypothetical protein
MTTLSNLATKPPQIERVNVNLPRPLLDDLRRLVPRSRRSEVIARATARELRRLQLAALFQDLAREAAWKREDHPELLTGAAIDAEIQRLRADGARLPTAKPRRRVRHE